MEKGGANVKDQLGAGIIWKSPRENLRHGRQPGCHLKKRDYDDYYGNGD
jgi:hypothetical protein